MSFSCCWLRPSSSHKAHMLLLLQQRAKAVVSCLSFTYSTSHSLPYKRGLTLTSTHCHTWAALSIAGRHYHTANVHAVAQRTITARPIHRTRRAVRTLEQPHMSELRKNDNDSSSTSCIARIGQPVRSPSIYAATLQKRRTTSTRHTRPHRTQTASSHDVTSNNSNSSSSSGTHTAAVPLTQQQQQQQPLHEQPDTTTTTTTSGNVLGKGEYDPALVIRLDSRRRVLKLNATQSELVWRARQAQYHSVLHRIVACLQSHRTPLQRCLTLIALHEELVIPHRLRLRTDTYEDIFHLFYATAIGSDARGMRVRPFSRSAADCMQEMWLVEHQASLITATTSNSSSATPREMSGCTTSADILLSPGHMSELWRMYRYMIDSGTNPSSRIAQYLMGLLEHCEADAIVEARAHSLLLDLDRFHCSPSAYTITSYIVLCDKHNVMHLALARMTDYQVRHERQASAGMYAALLTGLVRHGHYSEAMSAVTTMQSVPMSTHLLNAVLQTARHARSPVSAFTFYRAVLCPRRNTGQSSSNNLLTGTLVPSLHTFSILCEVMRETGEYAELDFVLREMARHGVKGNGMLLNKLLQALLHVGQRARAAQLARTMRSRRVHVFDELAKVLQECSNGSDAVEGSVVSTPLLQA